VLRIIHKKHLSLAVVLIIASFLMLVLSLYVIAARTTGQQKVITNQAVSVTTPFKNYTVNYPVFRNAGVDTIISHYARQQVDAFQGKLKGSRHDPRNHLTIDYDVVYQSDTIASILFYQREELQQEQQTTRRFMTFDLARRKLLSIPDIIQPGTEHRFIKLLHDYFKQHQETGVSPSQLVALLEVHPADIKTFAVTGESMFVYLDPHDPSRITPSAIEVKKTVLEPILRSEYRRTEDRSGVAVATEAVYVIATPPPDGRIVDPRQKMLALTFDDGPSYLTPGLLDTLQQYEANATFFVLGYSVQEHAATLRRMISEGSEIGNHSWGHADLRLLPHPQIDYQIGAPQQLVQSVTGGYLPRLMRPPYGATNPGVDAFLQQKGLTTALWNVDTFDWRDRDADLVYQRIMDSAGDNRVILLHDIHPTSVQAAQRAIPALKAQGYQLVTMSQLDNYR
jgi:peptidoglycan-N-acetylglucosamine deacetylase